MATSEIAKSAVPRAPRVRATIPASSSARPAACAISTGAPTIRPCVARSPASAAVARTAETVRAGALAAVAPRHAQHATPSDSAATSASSRVALLASGSPGDAPNGLVARIRRGSGSAPLRSTATAA